MLFHFLSERFSLDGSSLYALLIGCILLCMIVPYLFGSLNFSIIISRIFYHDDIRKYGSGNAGTTNMLRTYGKLPAAATLILDMSKGAVSVLFGYLLLGSGGIHVSDDIVTSSLGGTYLAGLFAVLGHMFPCFYRFRGGKGVATTAVVLLCTCPPVFLILLVIFVVIVVGTKMISLGSVMCMLMCPILVNRLDPTHPEGALISILLMLLVVFMHRANIKRIWEGTESKISFKKHPKTPTIPEETDYTEEAQPTEAKKANRPNVNTAKKKLKNKKNRH